MLSGLEGGIVLCRGHNYTFVAAKNRCWRGDDEGVVPQSTLTEEQRSQRRFSAQPGGRQSFSVLAVLLTPYRPLRVCSSLAPSEHRKPLVPNV